MQQERHSFPDSESGLALAFNLTLSLRRAGFKTRLLPRVIGTTSLHTLIATPATRPNRRARGCDVR